VNKKEPKKSSAAPASSPTFLLASQAKELVALRSTQTAFACPLGFEEWVPEVAAEARSVGLCPNYDGVHLTN